MIKFKWIHQQSRAFFRVLPLLAWVGWGWYQTRWVFPKRSSHQQEAIISFWSQKMLYWMGVRCHVQGSIAPAPLLLVANHLSWLDILVIHAHTSCHFIAKSEMEHWFLLGSMASSSKTLFIKRERPRDALRMVQHMIERFHQGHRLAVFPEGTTSDGQTLLPFHANLLQAALTKPTPIQTLALRYVNRDLERAAPIWVDAVTLPQTVWRTLQQPETEAYLIIHPPHQDADGGGDRQTLAHRLRNEIEQTLRPFLKT